MRKCVQKVNDRRQDRIVIARRARWQVHQSQSAAARSRRAVAHRARGRSASPRVKEFENILLKPCACDERNRLGPLLRALRRHAICSVAVLDRSMPSPVVRRLYPIQGRPPGHWERFRSHGSHVRPAIPQLRCRCASYEGDAGATCAR